MHKKYEILSVVGEGAYGIVYKCRNKETKEIVALKKFKETDDELVIKTMRRELEMLNKIKHENIVEFKESFIHKKNLYLVFEFVEKNLLELLQETPDGLNENKIKYIIYQLIKAIKYLHSQNIIHRDIKPENLLISKDLKLKLCDFGFSRNVILNEEKVNISQMTDYVATRWYRSPELLLNEGYYGFEVDYWSIGCIMGELTDGNPIFPGEDEIDQLNCIIKILGNLPPKLVDSFNNNNNFNHKKLTFCHHPYGLSNLYYGKLSNLAIDFMQGLLQLDKEKRLNGDNVLKHKYFQGYLDNQSEEIEKEMEMENENENENDNDNENENDENLFIERFNHNNYKENEDISNFLENYNENNNKINDQNIFHEKVNDTNNDNNKDDIVNYNINSDNNKNVININEADIYSKDNSERNKRIVNYNKFSISCRDTNNWKLNANNYIDINSKSLFKIKEEKEKMKKNINNKKEKIIINEEKKDYQNQIEYIKPKKNLYKIKQGKVEFSPPKIKNKSPEIPKRYITIIKNNIKLSQNSKIANNQDTKPLFKSHSKNNINVKYNQNLNQLSQLRNSQPNLISIMPNGHLTGFNTYLNQKNDKYNYQIKTNFNNKNNNYKFINNFPIIKEKEEFKEENIHTKKIKLKKVSSQNNKLSIYYLGNFDQNKTKDKMFKTETEKFNDYNKFSYISHNGKSKITFKLPQLFQFYNNLSGNNIIKKNNKDFQFKKIN